MALTLQQQLDKIDAAIEVQLQRLIDDKPVEGAQGSHRTRRSETDRILDSLYKQRERVVALMSQASTQGMSLGRCRTG